MISMKGYNGQNVKLSCLKPRGDAWNFRRGWKWTPERSKSAIYSQRYNPCIFFLNHDQPSQNLRIYEIPGLKLESLGKSTFEKTGKWGPQGYVVQYKIPSIRVQNNVPSKINRTIYIFNVFVVIDRFVIVIIYLSVLIGQCISSYFFTFACLSFFSWVQN